MEKKFKPNRVTFYADVPGGSKNQLFSWGAKNIDHALDIVAKFVQEKDYKIRAAWYVNDQSISSRIDKLINPKTKEVVNEYDFEHHKNSIVATHDRKINLNNSINQ